MGQDRTTVRNLEVIRTDRENNLLLVRGAIPGPRGEYILIKKGEFKEESA
jgi:large subunit ribosomal protein L3